MARMLSAGRQTSSSVGFSSSGTSTPATNQVEYETAASSSMMTMTNGCPPIPAAFVSLQETLELNNNSNEERRISLDSPSTLRLRALSLYRRLLRGAERMPTPNRQKYVIRKTRTEFRRHATLRDSEEIEFQLRLADTNLDTVLVQAEHLSRLFRDPDYQNYN